MSRVHTLPRVLGVAVAGCAAVPVVSWLLERFTPLHAPWSITAAAALSASVVAPSLLWLWRQCWQGSDAIATQLEAAGRGDIRVRQHDGRIEWEPLSARTNAALTLIQAQIDDRDQRLGQLREEIGADELTGLASRITFMDVLRKHLNLHAKDGQPGCVVLMRIDDLAGLNQRLGRNHADELLRAVGALLRVRLARISKETGLAARLNGADFGIVLPGITPDALDNWLKDLSTGLLNLRRNGLSDRPNVAWLAGGPFLEGDNPGPLLGRMDQGLQQSVTAHRAWTLVNVASTQRQLSIAQWRSFIDDAITVGRTHLSARIVQGNTPEPLHWLLNLRLSDEGGYEISGSDLYSGMLLTGRIAMAEQRLVELAIVRAAQSRASGQPQAQAVRVDARSAERPAFVRQLDLALEAEPTAGPLLWIEVDILGEREAKALLTPLAKVMRRHGAHLGLYNLKALPDDLPSWQAMGLSYLRLASTMTTGVSNAKAKNRLRMMGFLAEITHEAGLLLLADAVSREDDAAALRALGLACISDGPSHNVDAPILTDLLTPQSVS